MYLNTISGMACAKMFDELTRIKEPTPPPPEPQHDDPPAQPEVSVHLPVGLYFNKKAYPLPLK